MLNIGQMNELVILRAVDFGLYLDGGEFGDILIPGRYVPEDWEVGDTLNVFVYTDSEDRLIATTEIPYAMVGEFACLKVVSTTRFGAFLDWGLPKDLFLPLGEMKQLVAPGQYCIVFVYLDTHTWRVAASARLNQFLDQEPAPYKEGEEVDLFITSRTEQGYRAVINNMHWGVIFDNDLAGPLEPGTKMKGFIKRIRGDGKIDLTVRKFEFKVVTDILELIMAKLEAEGGFLPLTDKTDPALIYKMFGVSKKNFKRAVGALYRKRKIVIEPDGIRKAEAPGKKRI
jgi:uncharacterized protein